MVAADSSRDPVGQIRDFINAIAAIGQAHERGIDSR
jgi:hypothetical protein